INRIDYLSSLGCPLLLGASRKSVIGAVLGVDLNGREEATIALSVIAAMKGVQFVRVHSSEGNYKAVKMALAVREESI
ncbi:MAG: dihydropteroate synthase, partial [Clostridia bacterium]|nr:dihydropteroate synthase [Clostridia bacterium]